MSASGLGEGGGGSGGVELERGRKKLTAVHAQQLSYFGCGKQEVRGVGVGVMGVTSRCLTSRDNLIFCT